MNKDFRERMFTPVVLPLSVAGAMLLFAFSLSRVLLAVPEAVATFTALAVAGYILLIAALISSRPRITSRALGVGLALGLVGVLAAGAVAGAAGMRELEQGEEQAAAEGEGGGDQAAEGEGGGDQATEGGENGEQIPQDAAVFVAVDIDYEEAPDTLPAGEATIAIDNQGGIEHNVVIEELGEEPIVEADGGQTDVGTVTLEAGTYTYYCSIPGHRGAGMEGDVTVEG